MCAQLTRDPFAIAKFVVKNMGTEKVPNFWAILCTPVTSCSKYTA